MQQENKPIEQQEMERNAEEIERQIVRFTNIDNESFTHSFRGISTTVASGASQIMRLPEADHLAIHLARKILSRAKKEQNKANDKSQSLWNDKEINDLKSQILSVISTEPSQRLTAEESHKKDLESLNKEYSPIKENTTKEEAVTVTKKDIIKDLEARGVKVDVSKSKEELLTELMDLEQQG